MKQGEKKYILKKEHLANIVDFQLDEFIKDFKKLPNGDLEISYNYQGYKWNDKSHDLAKNGVMALSFFSGCGGLDIGAQMAGVKVLTSLDFYEDSVNTMKMNKMFSHTHHFCEDIDNVDGKLFSEIISKNKPEKLIILGGPPCQPFSKAGYWITNENRKSHDDPRNMIGSYFRLISEVKPDGFVLENVESLLHPSNKDAANSITDYMEHLGYNYTLLKINAADFGIPQKRKRVFYLASKKEINAKLVPTHGSEKDIVDNPNLLPYSRVIDWIAPFDSSEYWTNEQVSSEGKYENELKSIPPGKNYIALSERAGHPEPVFVAGKRYWSSLLKLHPQLPSWTIIASPGHWEGPFHWTNRRLSVRECASIQTFPEDYNFYGSPRSQRKQIGNAVPPLLGKLIVEELCKWI